MNGTDKSLMDVHGQPCLRALASRALKVTDQVLVTLPALDHPRATALTDLPVTQVPVPDAALGMSASLKTAATALPTGTTALLILPADMPEITAHDMAQLWAVFQVSGLRILQAATSAGQPGHPVIFDVSLLKEFQSLTGDKGAANIIRKNTKSHALFPLADDRAITDLDTPEEWLAWHAKTP